MEEEEHRAYLAQLEKRRMQREEYLQLQAEWKRRQQGAQSDA